MLGNISIWDQVVQLLIWTSSKSGRGMYLGHMEPVRRILSHAILQDYWATLHPTLQPRNELQDSLQNIIRGGEACWGQTVLGVLGLICIMWQSQYLHLQFYCEVTFFFSFSFQFFFFFPLPPTIPPQLTDNAASAKFLLKHTCWKVQM